MSDSSFPSRALSIGTGRRVFLRRCGLGLAAMAGGGLASSRRAFCQEKEVLPKHVTPETLRAVIKGLDYLRASRPRTGRGSPAAARPIRSR